MILLLQPGARVEVKLPDTGQLAEATFNKLTDCSMYTVGKYSIQVVNLRGFRASVDPRFESTIPDFTDGIPYFMEKFSTF